MSNKLSYQKCKDVKVKYKYWKNIYQYFLVFELSMNRIPIFKKNNNKL